MASRRYTGFDRDGGGTRPGLRRMIDSINSLSGGGLWNNGSYVMRMMRGKSSPSVHGTGRAVDLSWRGGAHGGYGSYDKARQWIDFLIHHADQLGIEMILDYYPSPYGGGYRCDRDAYKLYTSHTISGAPGGDWIHVEISPQVAENESLFADKLPSLWKSWGGGAGSPERADEELMDAPGPEDYPGHTIGLRHVHKQEVRAIQHRVGVKIDGAFGPITLEAVNTFQSEHKLRVTKNVNKKTWVTMFGVTPGKQTATVKSGEGWSQIAARALGDSGRWRELAGMNGGEDRVLHVGDVLMLPRSKKAKRSTVKVKAGEGWWQLAERALGSGARWAELAGLNGGEDRVLHVGDELDLPDVG